MSSIEVLEQQLSDHIREDTKWKDGVESQFNRIWVMIGGKMSKAEFYWVIGILITVLISMFAYIAASLDAVKKEQIAQREEQTIIKTGVANIQGKLEPYDIQFKN